MHGFVKNEEEFCKYKWINSSVSVFLILYVNEILLIENDIFYITGNKYFVVIIVLYKDLGKASIILGMKIYRDRSKSLLRLPQSMYIECL